MINTDFFVKRNKKGFAVYAGRPYKKGDVVCVMEGERKIPDDLFNVLQIGRGVYMNLKKPYVYFNHSCDPNTGMRGVATLFALKNIKKGEEITFDYSTTMWEDFRCLCGSKKCRGAVIDFFLLSTKTQEFYFKKGSLPDFINREYKKRNRKNV